MRAKRAGALVISISLRETAQLPPGQAARVGDVARAEGEEAHSALQAPLSTPLHAPLHRVETIDVLAALRASHPDLTVVSVGKSETWLARPAPQKPVRPWLHVLRAVGSAFVLFCGAGLAITYFHADVDMRGAQETLVQTLAPGADVRWLAVPYCIGVGVGVLAFFRLFGGRGPSPLQLKLSAWSQQVDEFKREQVEERDHE